MISCHASRLACPLSSLDHLLELQNGTAYTVSATPASLTALHALMPLFRLCLCSSMPHLIYCSSLGTMEAQAPLVSGTKKIPLVVLPHSVDTLLHHGLCKSGEMELQQRGWAANLAEGVQTTHTPL